MVSYQSSMLFIGLNDVVFPKPGTYEFVVLIEKEQKGKLPLYVSQIESQQE